MVYDKYGSQVYQKGLSQNTESMPTDVKNSFQQPFIAILLQSIYPLNEYYYFNIKKRKMRKKEKEKMKEDTEICFFCIVNFVQGNIK